ncbi:MAG: acyl-CoA dehydrogenase family protein [Methanomassiliicoccales archaeon]
MKFSEQHELVLDFVDEFAEKEVAPASLEIERNGIDRQLVSKLAERGYLGAVAPEDAGGAALDETSYLLLLERLSYHSPSVAYAVFLQNSLAIKMLLSVGRKDIVRQIATGNALCAVDLAPILSRKNRETHLQEGHVVGETNMYLADAGRCITVAGDAQGQKLLLCDGFSFKDVRPLGFRGAVYGRVRLSEETHCEVLTLDGAEVMRRTLLEASREVAAIALGICEACSDKTKQYASERKAFGSALLTFQPIAFELSLNHARIDALKEYLYRNVAGTLKDGLAAKMLLLEAALSTARLAMQVHGGNGYFEEYQIEKYYRDAMTLSANTSAVNEDLISLSHFALGRDSARL